MNISPTLGASRRTRRSGFFRNLPLSQKLLLAFGTLFIFTLIIAAVTLTGLNRTQASYDDALSQGIEIRRLSDQLENSLFQARSNEKDFLLHWREEGFETAYANYVTPHTQNVADMREDLKKLATFGPVVATLSTGNTSRVQYETDIATLAQNVDIYQKSFTSLADAYQRKGFDDGNIDFESKFRAAARLLEDETILLQGGLEKLQITTSTIRRNEKDYLLSQQQQYIDNIHLFIPQLKVQIEAADQLSPEVKAELLAQADVYLTEFDGLVALDKDIAAYNKDLVAAAANVEQLTANIKSQGEDLAIENINTARSNSARTYTISIFTAFIGLGVSILLAVALSQQLTRPILSLTNTVREISEGKIDVQAKVNSTDEIGTLAQSFNVMTSQLRRALQDLDGRAKELEQRSLQLERTSQQSEKRAQQLQTIAEIVKNISTEKDLNKLLPELTQTVSERFGFYHVGIFLLDDRGKFAVLLASNSPGGQAMLQRQHKLEVGQVGIVGNVTFTGNPRIVLDTGADTIYFNNPDLPLTRSELALPLKIEKQIIGALDIQSTEINAFSDEDVDALATLADEVSLAIQNARLFTQIEKSLAESNAIQRQYLREAWSNLPGQEKVSGYKYSLTGAVALEDDVDVATGAGKNNNQEINVPIVLRGETIGTLAVQAPQNEHVSTDQIDLIKAVAERVALSAENARLFEETTRRAERERIVSDIATKIGTSVRTESILRTTATELSQLLGGADILIKLGSAEEAK